ncbi:Xylose isomerase domain protein TIM barrel [alpha proteobacterium BAL199]|nr:Xylose isomerase domain protein TIM barrel [alpha proteobacterium BAL199]
MSLRPLGLAHFTVLEVPPPELVSLAARIGYSAIGLRLIQGAQGTPYYPTPAGSAEMRDLKLRLNDTGIRVHDVEIATIDEGFTAESLTGVLESAAAFGARTLSVCGDDPDRSRLTAKFAEFCDLAAGFGIGVDLEWMAWRRVRTLADALAIVTAADRPNGAILVDALHLSRTGSLPKDLRAVPAGLIRSVQLCDARAEAPTTTEDIIREARSGRLPPGTGSLPLDELLAELPADATLSLEVPMGTELPPEERASRVHAAMRTLLERQQDR